MYIYTSVTMAGLHILQTLFVKCKPASGESIVVELESECYKVASGDQKMIYLGIGCTGNSSWGEQHEEFVLQGL